MVPAPSGGPAPADAERRAKLLAAKLRALLKRRWPDAEGSAPASAGGGVAVVHGGRAWVLVDDPSPARGFARALLWGLHRRAEEIHVLVDAGDRGPALQALARRAACFRAVSVWAVSGADLSPAEAVPLPPEPPLDPDAEPFIPLIEAAGAEAVVEWGRLTAEVLGLQVARVTTEDGGAWLDVGIGKHDRLANRVAWAGVPPEEALSRVVDVALTARRSGNMAHPLNQLGRERWLRHHLAGRPAAVGAERLEVVSPPVPLGDLRLPLVAPAAGRRTGGGDVLVACSVGIDPTFVPMAAELHAARERLHPGEQLVLVLPEGDVNPLAELAVAGLRFPAAIRTVPDDWQTSTGP